MGQEDSGSHRVYEPLDSSAGAADEVNWAIVEDESVGEDRSLDQIMDSIERLTFELVAGIDEELQSALQAEIDELRRKNLRLESENKDLARRLSREITLRSREKKVEEAKRRGWNDFLKSLKETLESDGWLSRKAIIDTVLKRINGVLK